MTKAAVSQPKVNPKSKVIAKNRLPKKSRGVRPNHGVIYMGRLPKTFFEDDIKAFYKQFGRVLRVRLSRSKKNSHSKGYGYVEFEDEEVAKIAAEATNSYFISGRAIKVEFLPKDKIPVGVFDASKRRMVDMSKARINHTRKMYEKSAKQPNKETTDRLKEKLSEARVKYTLPTPQ